MTIATILVPGEIAIVITPFSPTVVLVTVARPLIEVPVILTLVWNVMRLEKRRFGTEMARVTLAAARAVGG